MQIFTIVKCDTCFQVALLYSSTSAELSEMSTFSFVSAQLLITEKKLRNQQEMTWQNNIITLLPSQWSCTQFLIEEKDPWVFVCVCLCVPFHCWLKINLPGYSQHSRPRSSGLGHLLGLKWPFIIHCQQQHSTQSGVSSHDALGKQAILCDNTRMSDSLIVTIQYSQWAPFSTAMLVAVVQQVLSDRVDMQQHSQWCGCGTTY